MFPPVTESAPEVLAQTALFVTLRDYPKQQASTAQSPWTSLVSRRFGGDVYERMIHLQDDAFTGEAQPRAVRIKSVAAGLFDVEVKTSSGTPVKFYGVSAKLISPTSLSITLNDKLSTIIIVSQPPPPFIPASLSHNTMERLHVFSGGRKTTLVIPTPKWLLMQGGDVLSAAAGTGALKAPMPSLVVEVRVKVGDRVEKGQGVIVLESMKTETVLRAGISGIVKAIGCKNGEMVQEGKELVNIEADEET